MMKWSEERKRKHRLIMQKSIMNRRYDQIIERRYTKEQQEIDNLWNEVKINKETGTIAREKAGFTQSVKNKVKERDNNKCKKCGRKAKYLAVHHIDGDFKNNNLNNLILVCKNCHNEMHGRLLKERWDFHHPLASRID